MCARIDSVTVDTVTLPSGIELLRFTFCGNGFLYNMVRILSGTLLSVGLGQIPAAQIPAIIEGKSRPACRSDTSALRSVFNRCHIPLKHYQIFYPVFFH